MSAKASFLVLKSVLHPPLIAEVTVFEPGFLIPLMVMQRCSASKTTQTDLASTACSIASAISDVSFSWSWGFLESVSTILATLERPKILPSLGI